MMSKYRPIYKKIWKDKDFKKSSKDAKLLFLYLTTNDAVNNSGIYEIPISTISEETGITQPNVRKLLQNDVIKNIKYDMENEIVFVVNARKYSYGGREDLVKNGIISEFKENSKTFLWSNFLELNPEFKDIFSTLDQGFIKGSVTVTIPIEDLDSKDLTNNKPLKIENEKKLQDNFDEDWKSYPKGGNRKIAFGYYSKKVGLDPEKRKAFLEKMGLYVASVTDPTFLKHGETFFNQWPDLEIRTTGPPARKQTKIGRNLDLIENIDLGEDHDHRRLQEGDGDHVRIGDSGGPRT